MKVSVIMIDKQDYFCFPPLGHYGVVYFSEQPICKVEDLIRFHDANTDRELVLGTIVAIEPPSSNIRPTNLQKDSGKWKLHWMPVNPEQVFAIQQSMVAHRCPNGCLTRPGVYDTKKVSGGIERYRKCGGCGSRWRTRESVIEIIKRPEKPSRRKAKT